MDIQRNSIVTIVLIITLIVTCYGVPVKKKNPRFPAIINMTPKSHPMLAALFRIASASQKADAANKLGNKGAGLKPRGPKEVQGPKGGINKPDEPTSTFLGFGASLMCQLCKEKNDLACIDIHCVNDKTASIAVQPGVVFNGISLPLSISADTPSSMNTGPANIQRSSHADVQKLTDKQNYPNTFGDFMKMKKYQGRPAKKQVHSAPISPKKPNAGIMNRPVVKPTKTETYPNTFGDFMKMKKYQGRPAKKQVHSAPISPKNPNAGVINRPIVKPIKTETYPNTFGAFMKMKKYQGRPAKKQAPSPVNMPQKPNTGVINRPVVKPTKTEAYPKTFGDFMKIKKYQGRPAKKQVPSPSKSKTAVINRNNMGSTNSRSLPTRTEKYPNTFSEFMKMKKYQGRPAKKQRPSAAISPPKQKQGRGNLARLPIEPMTMEMHTLMNLDTILYNQMQGEAAFPDIGSSQTRRRVNGRDNTNNFPQNTFQTINNGVIPFMPLTNEANTFGNNNNNAVRIPPAFGTSSNGMVPDNPFGANINDVIPIFPDTHSDIPFGQSSNNVPATNTQGTNEQREIHIQTNSLDMPQTGHFRLGRSGFRDSFSHLNRLPVSVSYGIPINGEGQFVSNQQPRNKHFVASASVPEVFARERLRR